MQCIYQKNYIFYETLIHYFMQTLERKKKKKKGEWERTESREKISNEIPNYACSFRRFLPSSEYQNDIFVLFVN